jgi:hypothetical protein
MRQRAAISRRSGLSSHKGQSADLDDTDLRIANIGRVQHGGRIQTNYAEAVLERSDSAISVFAIQYDADF